MASKSNLYQFNDIYDRTQIDLLKYVMIHCHNVNDANDIIQETYLEFWKILNKKEIKDDNLKSYLMGIANHKIKKYAIFLYKIPTISLFQKNSQGTSLLDSLENSINIEELVLKKDDWNRVWQYIKKKKNQDIPKVFFLYYQMELSILEIATCLKVKESYVKNLIYRTLKELQEKFGKERKSDQ